MQGRWYFPGLLHQNVFDFFRLHCRTAEEFEEFVRRLEQKIPSSAKAQSGLLKAGYVSKQQLLDYFFEVSGGLGVSVGNPLARIYDALIYWDVLSELPGASSGMRFDFQINFMVVQLYQEKEILENIIKGPGILVPRYYPATAAIIVEKDNQESIGSGAVTCHNGRTFILTNRHVVDPNEGIKIKEIFLADRSFPAPATGLVLSDKDDLAAFPISLPNGHPRFFLGDTSYSLQEVILLGFPKIPSTIKPHLTAHRGEINATIETRRNEQLYLVSNYASPGSSGGPLIDYRGLLIGIISDSLEGEYEGSGSMFQHSAAVTLDRVRQFADVFCSSIIA